MSDACCEPILDLANLQRQQRRVLRIVLAINLATFALMACASWSSGSTSLLSGSLDNLGDAVTYALSLAVVGSTLAAQSRVALVKGFLIAAAALAVGALIVRRLVDPTVPIFETMGLAGVANLAANAVCLWLLTPYRHGDVNLASAWECSRNDIVDGIAVLAAAGLVFAFAAGWPDVLVAAILLVVFTRSSARVLAQGLRGLRRQDSHASHSRVSGDQEAKAPVAPQSDSADGR